VLRLDVTPWPGMVIGGSLYYGDSGQDLEASVSTEIYEAHADWKHKGFSLRALGTVAHLDDVAELNRIISADATATGVPLPDSDIDSIGEEMWGWYIEAGFDVFSLLDKGEQALTPFIRYEQLDTQSDIPSGFEASGKNDIEIITLGLNFKPRDEIVFKADYQINDDEADSLDDQFNLAIGYVF